MLFTELNNPMHFFLRDQASAGINVRRYYPITAVLGQLNGRIIALHIGLLIYGKSNCSSLDQA